MHLAFCFVPGEGLPVCSQPCSEASEPPWWQLTPAWSSLGTPGQDAFQTPPKLKLPA